MNYKVDPGLYALGEPNADSPVLVSANYKLSFDALRSALPGRNFWILVVDTDGVNVWCAAGKGTFSTEELVSRIESSGLTRLVSHRLLIVPQLAAPGVAAHRVRELSGFKIKYGPIRSKGFARVCRSKVQSDSGDASQDLPHNRESCFDSGGTGGSPERGRSPDPIVFSSRRIDRIRGVLDQCHKSWHFCRVGHAKRRDSAERS